jgi:hypothetical protein
VIDPALAFPSDEGAKVGKTIEGEFDAGNVLGERGEKAEEREVLREKERGRGRGMVFFQDLVSH